MTKPTGQPTGQPTEQKERELTGRVALVTGGAGGCIGRATVTRLAREGAVVVLADNREDRCLEIAEKMSKEFSQGVHGYGVDIADRDRVDEVLAEIEATIGPVDILINNAAVNFISPVSEYKVEEWDRVMDVDLNACFYLTRKLLPGMMQRGWGSIVNVTSVAGWLHGYGQEGPYAAAKAALHSLTRAIAFEGGPHGVRCNAVAPGIIDGWFIQQSPKQFEREKKQTPLRRFGTGDEVANVIYFLVSEQSGFVTGDVINVSGGWYMRG
jgi:NAD(P)-dependent dehydrogenase (short-subunit alcohol dehydrogenase family)